MTGPSGSRAPTEWQQLAEIADLYYHEQQTQADIADRLGISRVKVSRLLTRAAVLGVVEFVVHRENPRNETLERELEQAFPGLRAYVVGPSAADLPTAIGRLAASAAEPHLVPGGTAAISYGRAVHETIRAISSNHLTDLTVVQMAGVEGATNPAVDGWDLVRYCALRLGGGYLHLPAGLFSSSVQLHDVLRADPAIATALERAARADLAIVGVGSMEITNSSLVRAGHLDAQGLAAARGAGSVGYIGGQHYDVDGRPLDELNRLTLSLDLHSLRRVAQVMGVAHGPDKALPLLGALRGGFLTIVVTDDVAARTVLQNATPEDRSRTLSRRRPAGAPSRTVSRPAPTPARVADPGGTT